MSQTQELFSSLQTYLESRVPGSRLELTKLPQAPELSLYLINHDYPRGRLNSAQAAALMESPPFWGFCWASGQVLARSILDNPGWVEGRTLVDFGAGSGVVGIAAKMAGAKRVILCDQDEKALLAGKLNGRINGVRTEFSSALSEVLKGNVSDCLVTVADVFYDPDNLPLLEILLERFALVLVSDSRQKGRPLPGMEIIGRYESHTVPDLDESREFNHVTIYRSQQVR